MGNSAAKGLPYTQGAPIGSPRFRSPFTIYEGVSTNPSSSSSSTNSSSTGSSSLSTTNSPDKVLLFRYDKRSINSGNNNSWGNNADTALAQNALKRLRMLRHPNVVKFIVSNGNKGYC